VHVSAKDLGTGKEQSMTITGGSALPKDDIERMMREAEAHAEEDRQRREAAETRNQAESLVYQTEKFLRDNAEKLSGDATSQAKADVEAALDELKKTLEGNDTAAMKAATEKLATTSQALGTAMYASAQPGSAGAGAGGAGFGGPGFDEDTSGAGGAQGSSAGSTADEEVVDAEIVDDESKGNL
jgi:molecular chaperone DnaK